MLVMATGGWPKFSKHWALLGSEMLRDGKIFIGTARNTPDPFIDYLDCHNICWLPILDYVDANHGWQDENGIWRGTKM